MFFFVDNFVVSKNLEQIENIAKIEAGGRPDHFLEGGMAECAERIKVLICKNLDSCPAVRLCPASWGGE